MKTKPARQATIAQRELNMPSSFRVLKALTTLLMVQIMRTIVSAAHLDNTVKVRLFFPLCVNLA